MEETILMADETGAISVLSPKKSIQYYLDKGYKIVETLDEKKKSSKKGGE